MNNLYSDLIKILAPPGNGLYAVTTMADRKDNLHNIIYPGASDITNAWQESLKNDLKLPYLLGVPSDCGGGILRGANWGPLFIRENLYPEYLKFLDLGDIRVIPQLLVDEYLNRETIEKCQVALYEEKNSSLPVSPLSITEYLCDKLYQDKNTRLLALGGDHSISYPLVKSYLKSTKEKLKKTAVIHFDAHTDLLEARLGLPITFGSWVYHVLDYLENPSNFIQIGIRASRYPKKYWEEKYGVSQFWADEILSTQISSSDVIDNLHKKGIENIYISFDVDAIDSNFVSATGTAEKSGLEPEFSYNLVKSLVDEFNLISADIVEVAPLLKIPDSDQTLKIAKDLAIIMLEGMQK